MATASDTVGEATALLAELVWLVILAAALAGLAALLYQWYVREPVPAGLSLLLGLAGVTVYLNTSRALGQVIAGSTLPTEREVALFNVAAFALATGGAVLGRRAGDRLGADVSLRGGVDGVERDVGRLVQSVGRVVAVELPEEIADVVGYDPVPGETKDTLAGRTFLFPRTLTVDELEGRLAERLRADYAVGHVDVELAADGTVEYLAVGSRAAGIGPTLPPATNAVAIRADPAFAASAGDLVQVWETDPARRVLTAELRGVAEDTVTIAIDAADTTKVDPREEYRLVTLPVEDRPDREFASLLRAADETSSSVTVAAGSPLHGLPVGALDLTVVAVESEDGRAIALPERSRVLAPGERVFAIAPPDELRRLETAAEPLDPSLVPTDRRPTDEPTPTPATGEDDRATPEPTGDAAEAAAERSGGAAAQGPTDADLAGAPDDPTGQSAPHGAAERDSPAESTATEGGAAGEPRTTTEDETAAESRTAEEIEAAEEDARADEVESTAEAEEVETDEEAGVTGQAGGSSFQDLKDAFESGEAEWATDEGDGSAEQPAGRDGDETEGDDDDAGVGLEDVEVDDEMEGAEDPSESDDEGDDGGPFEFDEGADGEDLVEFDEGEGDEDLIEFDETEDDENLFEFDDGEDDEELFEFDEGEDDEGLFEPADDVTGGDDGTDSEADDSDEADDRDEADDSDDDDDSDGGGGKSFQELKEEFESGEADWSDDVSDSPGGDMRLDE